jgi:O-antigen/teichoic acid export membrane protein
MSNKSGSLKERAVRAGIWITMLGMAGTALRFGSSMIMTRLLVPDIFGIVALAGVVYMIISLLSDIGLRQCVIYSERGEERRFLDTVWSISAMRGAFISVAAALVAAGIGWGASRGWFDPKSVYAHPDLPGVLALTALSSLLLGFKSPKLYVCERHLDFRTVVSLEFLGNFVGAVATIYLTWRWRSVWAIVVGGYANTITTLALSHFSIPGPIGRLRWDKDCAREIVRYGRWILMSSTAYVFASNGDRILLGAWATPAMLGFYMLALNMVNAFESIVSRPFVDVGMPAFSELGRTSRSEVRKKYLRFRRPLDLATVLGSGILFATGQTLIKILYDPRYVDAGRTLQILSMSLLFMRYGTIGVVHSALGRPHTLAWTSVVKLASVYTIIPLGYFIGGYEGAIWAIALHMIPSTAFLFWRNREFQLNDFAFEFRMLLMWPVGFAGGWLAAKSARPVLGMLGWF